MHKVLPTKYILAVLYVNNVGERGLTRTENCVDATIN